MTDNSLSCCRTRELESATPIEKRTHKYNNDNERYEASKANKRKWYYNNKEQQKLKSLKQYYVNQLKKEDLKEDIKTKYENKLNTINEKLVLSNNLI